MTVALADPQRLHTHYDEFTGLVATAQDHLRRGRLDAAAAYAQMAGHYAWMNHTGTFASPELEQLLAALGARLRQPPAAARSRGRRPARCCTWSPSATGPAARRRRSPAGSSRTQSAIIACASPASAGRRRRTRSARRCRSDADLIRLDTERGGLIERAARLRALAAEADVVVLHLHPYDVVPVIAFSGARGLPPVIYVDHCDHVFWLGTSISSVVMHMRDSGRRLAAARRGLDPARSAVVARPLRPAGRTTSREEAKRALGIDPGSVLLVTAADGTKYRPVGPPSFLDLVVPVLERHPSAILHAAGPSPEGEWEQASERTGGRLRALGMIPDVRLLQEAADVYLDSYPFSSLTSLLEAGSLGVPAITYRGHPDDCGVLGADTRGVDEHMLTASDPAEFERALGGLIADPRRREQLGESTRARDPRHPYRRWLAQLRRGAVRGRRGGAAAGAGRSSRAR